MEPRVSLITIGVKDMKRARSFYDALGWRAASGKEREADIVCYDLPGMALALHPWEMLAADANVPMERSGYSAITLAHNVRSAAEVDKTLDLARKAGGRIVKPAAQTHWGGYSGYFADPDGQLWEIAYNPFSPLGPEGQFQWNGA
ncbi:MAG: VOC family protein [Micavibrio aeruginosavorus]|uniref:VOC family protein n=1 Tax=Micavibrio aeruginosavorus TaxID=349221 RepID=A0A7T5R497_9BACT|nr:MAG: VOC family protein [Micavibrio aeruginosavorus]